MALINRPRFICSADMESIYFCIPVSIILGIPGIKKTYIALAGTCWALARGA